MTEGNWNGRKILSELADSKHRREILSAFWKSAEQNARQAALIQLARALHFREETLRKAPAEKKADWLAARLHDPLFEESFEMALMLYHTTRQTAMLGAFLDAWGIPHVDGSIEVDEYKVPTVDQVSEAVAQLSQFDRADVAIYLATAGMLMGPEWASATWPVVERMREQPASR